MSVSKALKEIEIGPIRPPSEAESLLIRVSRNCPWNNCKFCGLYKGESFSVRKKEDIFAEIDVIKKCLDVFFENEKRDDYDKLQEQYKLQNELEQQGVLNAYQIALNWYRSGMKSIFLQDSNSMVVKTEDLIEIIRYLKKSFPNVARITSYARSQTIVSKSGSELAAIREAGLDRIHIGVESGSDEVLEFIKKGASKEIHIEAGQKVKNAGFELSVYYMPGLGGTEHWAENALDTADVMNHVNPDYIRIRTLAIPNYVPLAEDCNLGSFVSMNDIQVVQELRLFIENLHNITSTIVSDHILNLIPSVEGKLPKEKNTMLRELGWFLNLSDNEQMIFRIGRRTGQMFSKEDLKNANVVSRVVQMMKRNSIGQHNVDQIITDLMKNFI